MVHILCFGTVEQAYQTTVIIVFGANHGHILGLHHLYIISMAQASAACLSLPGGAKFISDKFVTNDKNTCLFPGSKLSDLPDFL
jgi:hypothetical protein